LTHRDPQRGPQASVLHPVPSPAGYADCVPTPRAVRAGGYGAEILVNMIDPEGGQALVRRTIAVIGELFKK
jgi:hypothetical protein